MLSDFQVCLRDLIEFLYVDHDQLTPSEAPTQWLPSRSQLFAGTDEYILVKPDGEILKFKLAGPMAQMSSVQNPCLLMISWGIVLPFIYWGLEYSKREIPN